MCPVLTYTLTLIAIMYIYPTRACMWNTTFSNEVWASLVQAWASVRRYLRLMYAYEYLLYLIT